MEGRCLLRLDGSCGEGGGGGGGLFCFVLFSFSFFFERVTRSAGGLVRFRDDGIVYLSGECEGCTYVRNGESE